MYTYKTKGTCSTQINFDIVEGKVTNASFINGCDGNTKGVCKLVEGMDAKEAIQRLKGITCRTKPTSCPDQLAQAIEKALEESK